MDFHTCWRLYFAHGPTWVDRNILDCGGIEIWMSHLLCVCRWTLEMLFPPVRSQHHGKPRSSKYFQNHPKCLYFSTKFPSDFRPNATLVPSHGKNPWKSLAQGNMDVQKVGWSKNICWQPTHFCIKPLLQNSHFGWLVWIFQKHWTGWIGKLCAELS